MSYSGKGKYRYPAYWLRHTVAYCYHCRAQKTFSCGRCDGCYSLHGDLLLAKLSKWGRIQDKH